MEAEGPTRARRSVREPRRKRRGGLIAFLIGSAVPIGALVVYAVLPQEKRDALAEKIPEGAGGRAITAAVAFGILALLAWVALPAFHNASGRIRDVLHRMRGQPMGLRVLLFPVYAVVWLFWFTLQMLFAVDAFGIIVLAFVALLLAIRIVEPDFLPAVLSNLRR